MLETSNKPECVADLVWATEQLGQEFFEVGFRFVESNMWEQTILVPDEKNDLIHIRKREFKPHYANGRYAGDEMVDSLKSETTISFEEFKDSPLFHKIVVDAHMKGLDFNSQLKDKIFAFLDSDYKDCDLVLSTREYVSEDPFSEVDFRVRNWDININQEGNIQVDLDGETVFDGDLPTIIQDMKELRRFRKAGLHVDKNGNIVLSTQE